MCIYFSVSHFILYGENSIKGFLHCVCEEFPKKNDYLVERLKRVDEKNLIN